MKQDASNGVLAYTGERMVPELAGDDTFWEHINRYRFAARYVGGKDVLDIACGEGYGASGLRAAGAASIVGIDISEEACEHARRRYQLDARCGSANAIPVGTQSVDLVVSFETLEHVDDQKGFVSECHRVLRTDGMLIISTPNRSVYSENGHHNPFHCAELDENEFVDLLAQSFQRVRLFSQAAKSVGPWSVRSLSAVKSPWQKVRGYYWLRQKLLRFSPDSTADSAARSRPDSLIAATEPWFAGLGNPYRLRPRSRVSAERPTYLIAVCNRS